MSNRDSANREALSFGPPGDRNDETRGEILPTCAECGAYNPTSCRDHDPGCSSYCAEPNGTDDDDGDDDGGEGGGEGGDDDGGGEGDDGDADDGGDGDGGSSRSPVRL
ncbi:MULTISPECIES: hypothetical protein [unclassified Bradyrhizobium]|uniref:hypothetical protein n=1 Tax=unclassified Bradyrhizobium TaxID=2631580 RepID=UPI0028E6045C|nr:MULTISPECIES: hypothetical protein [unclassified Bradyrhizobium]